MSSNIILSIIIPSYNKEKQLVRLLDSIVNSSVFDSTIEIIISDDCSTDNTKNVVQDYIQKWDNIKYILSKENGGVHTARNLGMQQAKGEYIGFIDGDDWFNKDGLKIVIEKIVKHSIYDLIYFPYITSDTSEKTGYTRSGAITLKELFLEKGLFKRNKNGFAVVRNKIIKENNIQWYYTNLDSLFWRECEYYAYNQSIYVTDDIVGIYDTSTEGSLSKKRSDINHLRKTADIKIEKTIEFLNHLEKFFKEEKIIGCQYIFKLKNDFIISRNKDVNYQLLKKYSDLFNCSKIRLLFIKSIPVNYFKIKLKFKNFVKKSYLIKRIYYYAKYYEK